MNKDRLGVVARLRRYSERQSQRDLATAQQRLEAARKRLDLLRRPSHQVQVASLSAAHLMALRAQGIVQAEDLAEARDEWKRCDAQVREAIHAVQSATSRRRASDELLKKRRLAHAAIAAKAAQAALDELVTMRHTRELQS